MAAVDTAAPPPPPEAPKQLLGIVVELSAGAAVSSSAAAFARVVEAVVALRNAHLLCLHQGGHHAFKLHDLCGGVCGGVHPVDVSTTFGSGAAATTLGSGAVGSRAGHHGGEAVVIAALPGATAFAPEPAGGAATAPGGGGVAVPPPSGTRRDEAPRRTKDRFR